ncbi:hypothetical protein ACHAWF_011881 [Thalassiosira exigua]
MKKPRRNKSSAHGRRKNAVGRGGKVRTNVVDRDEANDGDLEGIKKWIASLSFDSLADALEFTFHEDEAAVDHRRQENLRGIGGDRCSQDFDLLMEMALPQCLDDDEHTSGLGEVERSYRRGRSTKAQLKTPCLFRWDDSEDENPNPKEPTKIKGQVLSHRPGPCDDDPLASLSLGAAGMPSELLDVLAKAGVKRSTSSLLETFNEVDEMDEAFESLEDRGNIVDWRDDTSAPINFRVKADRWISDDGAPLGRGTTMKQRDSDESIVLWTCLLWDRVPGADAEGDPDKSTSPLPQCRLIIDVEPSERSMGQCKKLLLDTLTVASRGNFLSKAGKRKRAYLAPWLDPTQRWFSLPMYLASRFEASLWDAYRHRSTTAPRTNEKIQNSLRHSVKSLAADASSRVLSEALGNLMREKLLESLNATKSPKADSLLETFAWKLIIWDTDGKIPGNCRQFGFAATPLLEWDTPPCILKSLLMNYLQEALAHEAERSLLQSSPTTENRKVKSTKKKKKRPKKNARSDGQFASKRLECAQNEDTRSDNDDDDDDEPHVECILPNATPGAVMDRCEADLFERSPPGDNNSTKMAVLKVLDDILINVFVRLGVQDEEFSDFTDAVTVKSRGESLHKKTPSADDIEVQQTSRTRRQTVEGANPNDNNVSHLKRSKSSGDGPMTEKKPPMYPSKIPESTPPRSSGAPVWPSSDSPLFPQASQSETSIFDGAPLCLSGALDGWNGVACQTQNNTTIFTDLLKKGGDNENSERADKLASSTAASIASSRENFAEDAGLDIDGDCDDSSPLGCDAVLGGEGSTPFIDENKNAHFKNIPVQCVKNMALPAESSETAIESTPEDLVGTDIIPEERADSPISGTPSPPPQSAELSPTPSAPPTPPPQLSPILVSLADLGKLREEVASLEFEDKSDRLPQIPPFRSIPKPPALTTRPLTPSLSREDLRSIDEFRKPPRRSRDDHHTMGHRQVDALLSYRNVVAQSGPRKPPSLKSYDGKQKLREDSHPIMSRSTRSTKTTRSGMWQPGPEFPNLSASVSSMPSYKEPILNKVLTLDAACAKSEGGLDGVDDASHCNVIPRAQADDTMTKDGATTISSVHYPPEKEQVANLKEERDSYRDMCLTLGAENAKLRNLLASKTCTPIYHPTTSSFSPEATTPHFYHNDQQFVPTFNGYPNQFFTHSIAAMSDAGVHRGDYESSAMSEDGTEFHPSVVAIGESQNGLSWQARGDSVQSFGRRTSGGGTCAESDISFEHNVGFHRVHQQDSFFGPIPLHGMQSRLSKDVTRYMQTLKSQLKKNEPRRLWALKQLEVAVKALWPRAQIKMYGSHVTKLCLPSSDMDFVISLPAVHKNAPAMAPGDLEGRNAIVETNQKVLARKLKSESWIDQRSLKVIERTAVPVIKVSTKDSRSRVVQLDLSFDAKEHHGLEALKMIQRILEV